MRLLDPVWKLQLATAVELPGILVRKVTVTALFHLWKAALARDCQTQSLSRRRVGRKMSCLNALNK